MKFTIAIDLGGTIIKIGLMNNGHLIDRKELHAQSSTGLKAHTPALEIAIDEIMKANQLAITDILGIGFSFPGLVDSSNNKILSTNKKYDDGSDTDLVTWAWNKWALPLYVENDVRLALLGGNSINNDILALEILDHCYSVWSSGIISMIHAFDPEMIIISGGIIKSGSVIMPELQSRINQFAWTPWGKVKLVEAQYPDSAALFGAYYMV